MLLVVVGKAGYYCCVLMPLLFVAIEWSQSGNLCAG